MQGVMGSGSGGQENAVRIISNFFNDLVRSIEARKLGR